MPARERLLNAAYELFSAHGIAAVGINRILDQAGCAKASLYKSFGSKSALILAFLDLREQRWTRDWLEAEIVGRAPDPEGRLMAVFDLFGGWFRQPDYEGCSFMRVALEAGRGSVEHRAAVQHLGAIRSIFRQCAQEAALDDPDAFAKAWFMLVKGSIVSACTGERNAAAIARRAGRMLLDSWPRLAR